LPKKFYARDPAYVARGLLGKVLCRVFEESVLAGFIVETEAYYGRSDPASRAYRGSGDLASTLCGDIGVALVYGVHGRWLFNIVAHTPGGCGGILIRALEPISGVEVMKRFRGTDDVLQLTNGPGKLSEALAIDKRLHKVPVYSASSEVTVRRGREERDIARGFRVGVTEDLDVPLRFYVKSSKFISTRRY